MLRNFVLSHLSEGVRSALRNLKWELQAMRMHRRGSRRAAQFGGQRELKLHLGCGDNLKSGFVNIDLNSKADLTLDLRAPLPFRDDCCCFIYSEHFLEHLEYPNVVLPLLRECCRVLQSGGIFSAGVPDTEWPILEYARVRNDGILSAREGTMASKIVRHRDGAY